MQHPPDGLGDRHREHDARLHAPAADATRSATSAGSTANYIEGDTPLALSGDDAFTSVSLPFSFSLYGKSYSSANVCTNGYISFLAGNCIFTNSGIPSTALPNGAIYPYWDDLIIDGSSSMWTKTLTGPNRFVIEWRNARYFDDSTRRVDFEVVLYENGQILTQYRNIADDARERAARRRSGSRTRTARSRSSTPQRGCARESPTTRSGTCCRRRASCRARDRCQRPPGARGGDGEGAAGRNTVRSATTDAAGFYQMQFRSGATRSKRARRTTRPARRTSPEDATVTTGLRAPHPTRRGQSDVTRVRRCRATRPRPGRSRCRTPAASR